jgi:hypothetical protein
MEVRAVEPAKAEFIRVGIVLKTVERDKAFNSVDRAFYDLVVSTLRDRDAG